MYASSAARTTTMHTCRPNLMLMAERVSPMSHTTIARPTVSETVDINLLILCRGSRDIRSQGPLFESWREGKHDNLWGISSRLEISFPDCRNLLHSMHRRSWIITIIDTKVDSVLTDPISRSRICYCTVPSLVVMTCPSA